MIKYKRRGIRSFLNKKYKDAFMYFSLALQENPEDKELRIYVELASLALQREDEAISLFDFYRANLKGSFSNKLKNPEEIFDSLQIGLEKLRNIFDNKDMERFVLEENGVSYEDFLSLVESRGGFTRAFEDIMFSTKVIISKKEDFIHFLNLLVDNNFTEMALNYLENAVSMFPEDSSLQDLAKKMEQKR